jgi:5-methylcytosine-specific restriction endonuclease McrA
MPMDRSLYPDDWDAIAYQVKEAADWTCQRCGKACYRPGQPALDRRKVLTVHHKDHNPQNCADDNLEALCAPCHLREEVAYRIRLAYRAARKAGQLILPGMEVTDG